mmetsp:Transcript_6930/g.23020  ORF Transcript_6930/g.23020 Transcript_6930/m.23020 type:complete len:301 (+) Transcript_6930:2259-3161(+)
MHHQGGEGGCALAHQHEHSRPPRRPHVPARRAQAEAQHEAGDGAGFAHEHRQLRVDGQHHRRTGARQARDGAPRPPRAPLPALPRHSREWWRHLRARAAVPRARLLLLVRRSGEQGPRRDGGRRWGAHGRRHDAADVARALSRRQRRPRSPAVPIGHDAVSARRWRRGRAAGSWAVRRRPRRPAPEPDDWADGANLQRTVSWIPRARRGLHGHHGAARGAGEGQNYHGQPRADPTAGRAAAGWRAAGLPSRGRHDAGAPRQPHACLRRHDPGARRDDPGPRRRNDAVPPAVRRAHAQPVV